MYIESSCVNNLSRGLGSIRWFRLSRQSICALRISVSGFVLFAWLSNRSIWQARLPRLSARLSRLSAWLPKSYLAVWTLDLVPRRTDWLSVWLVQYVCLTIYVVVYTICLIVRLLHSMPVCLECVFARVDKLCICLHNLSGHLYYFSDYLDHLFS